MELHPPVIAAVCAAILGLLGILLTIRVILKRVKYGVNKGDGDVADLAQAIRAQGNFTEQVALALIVLTFTEVLGAPVVLVLVLGAALVLARLFSAIGLSRSLEQSFFRQSGAGLTALSLGVASITVLYFVFL